MEILDLFNIPEPAKIEQRVYVKDLVSALELVGKDKLAIEKSISTVVLRAVFNEQTTGIWGFESDTYAYKAIYLFYITLKNDSKIRTINEFVHRAFPNPTILVYQIGSKYYLSTALKRINKQDRNKTVIDDIQITDDFLLDDNHISLLSHISYSVKDLKQFYENIDYIVSADYILKTTGRIPEPIDFTVKSKSLMIQQLLTEKRKCQADLKLATSVREKMELNSRIKDIDKTLEGIR